MSSSSFIMRLLGETSLCSVTGQRVQRLVSFDAALQRSKQGDPGACLIDGITVVANNDTAMHPIPHSSPCPGHSRRAQSSRLDRRQRCVHAGRGPLQSDSAVALTLPRCASPVLDRLRHPAFRFVVLRPYYVQALASIVAGVVIFPPN